MRDYSSFLAALRGALPGLAVREREPMREHTTLKIGGPARLFLEPGDPAEAAEAVRLLKAHEVRYMVLGNGSNVLFGDGELDLAILSLAGLNAVEERGSLIAAGAGASLSRAASEALRHGLTGLEFAHGIPGSVGGGVFMNAGAYGGELKDVVRSVTVLEEDGRVAEVPGEACGFSYRHSAFEDTGRAVLGASFALTPGDPEAIRARMADLAQKRREKQPLEYPSAGSTFKRPQGAYAAQLIDEAGLKGLTVGGAQVSEKHAGFLVNRGGATAADFLALMDRVRETVYARSGILLEPEVRVVTA